MVKVNPTNAPVHSKQATAKTLQATAQRKSRGRKTPAGTNKTQLKFDAKSKKLDVSASLQNYILYVANKFKGGPVGPFEQHMDPYLSDYHDERKTYEGDSAWPHLVLWAKMGLIDHHAYPLKEQCQDASTAQLFGTESPAQKRRRILREKEREERMEEEEKDTIYGMWNYEIAYDNGTPIRFLPKALKNKDGTPFDWSKCDKKYTARMEKLAFLTHKLKYYSK